MGQRRGKADLNMIDKLERVSIHMTDALGLVQQALIQQPV